MKATKRTGKQSTQTHQQAKPYPEFPLTAHPSERWAKKHKGKRYYFGPLDDWESALKRYKHAWPYIITGRTPPPMGSDADYLTLAQLCNRFLTSRKHLLDVGELSDRSFRDYLSTCDRLVNAFGRTRSAIDLRPDDFQSLRASIAKTRGPVALGNEIQRVRMVFKFAYDSELIDRPVRFGPGFKKPSKKTLRLHRHERTSENGKRMFESSSIRNLIDAADQPLKAMILLGINCGFGQTDFSTLPKSAIDFDSGWIDFPRPKTGIERRCPLWPQTLSALRESLETRPDPKDANQQRALLHHEVRQSIRANEERKDADRRNQP